MKYAAFRVPLSSNQMPLSDVPQRHVPGGLEKRKTPSLHRLCHRALFVARAGLKKTLAAQAGRKLVALPNRVNQLSCWLQIYRKNRVLGHFSSEKIGKNSC